MALGTVGEKIGLSWQLFQYGFLGCIRGSNESFAGTSDVTAVDVVRGPSATLGRGFEDQDLGAWGCEWGAVEIKGTVQLGLCREAWVDPGCPEKVKGQGFV